MHFGLFLWGLLMRLLRLLRCVRRVYRVCVCVAPGQSLERWPLSTCRWTSSCWHAELPNLYWIFSSENGPLQMTEPFHSPRQNYAILKKDARARARATFSICSSIPRGGVVVVTPRGGGRFHENFMKTPIS